MTTQNKCVIWGTALSNLADPTQGIKDLIKKCPFFYQYQSNHSPDDRMIYNPWAGGKYTLSHKLFVGLVHGFNIFDDDTDIPRPLNDKEKIRLSGHIARENLKSRIPSLDEIMQDTYWLKQLSEIPDGEEKAFLLLKGLVTLYPEEGSGISLDLSLNQPDTVKNDPTPFLRALSYSTNQENFKYLLYDILEENYKYIDIDPYTGGKSDIQITPKGFEKIKEEKNKTPNQDSK